MVTEGTLPDVRQKILEFFSLLDDVPPVDQLSYDSDGDVVVFLPESGIRQDGNEPYGLPVPASVVKGRKRMDIVLLR